MGRVQDCLATQKSLHPALGAYHLHPQPSSSPPQLAAAGTRVPWGGAALTLGNKGWASTMHSCRSVVRLAKISLPQILQISHKFKKCKIAGLEERLRYGDLSFSSSSLSGLWLCHRHVGRCMRRTKRCFPTRTANNQSMDNLQRPHCSSFTKNTELQVPPCH